MSAYLTFLDQKVRMAPAVGFDPVDSLMPAAIKPFQRDIVTWACRRGRAAVFAGTGLGKTIQELTWAQQVTEHTGGRVLLFTPLAVAEQTVAEAAKFGIDGVAYAKDEASISTPIVVTNYDRRQHFDPADFAGVVLDESGIIKDHDSRTRNDLTEACRDVPYLLCGSATPAPNDWTELGQHAEFLNVMSAKEMLAMFFVHDGAVRANAEEEWRLKRHAAADFWRWVASWSVMIRHPRDLGYDEPGYDLPPLDMRQVTVKASMAPAGGMLFPMQANTMQERLAARRDSIAERVAEAARLVAEAPDEPWLIWCNLNAEADALVKAIPGAVNVQGFRRPRIEVQAPARVRPWRAAHHGQQAVDRRARDELAALLANDLRRLERQLRAVVPGRSPLLAVRAVQARHGLPDRVRHGRRRGRQPAGQGSEIRGDG
jgi:hypothetical protein